MLNEVMYKFAELLEELPKTAPSPAEVTLLPNRFAALELDASPTFSENVFLKEAVDTDLKLLKEKKHPQPDSNIIEKAHPNRVYVSNALGDGGLVENQNQQHEKFIQVLNKRPTGQLINTYAQIAESLTKVAAYFDQINRPEIASKVDEALATIFTEKK